MIIDSHAHLNDDRLIDQVESIVSTMQKDNLEAIVNVSYDIKSAETGLELAKKFNNIYTTLGIHPHDSKSAKQSDYDYFSLNAKSNKVVAIGEIGLDYYYDFSPRETQKEVFIEQLELANHLSLPVVFHLRDAYADFIKILKEHKNLICCGGLMHCYSGSLELVNEFSKFDFYFAFGGAITFKNAKKDNILNAVPRDRLMIETDCPYMAPEPYRGRTNYPKMLNLVAQKLADSIQLSLEEVEKITTENTKRFYNKMV